MLRVAGYFLKIAKINSQGEKPICPNQKKISYRITQKSPIRKNKLPQKFRAKRYVDLAKTFEAGHSNAILEEIFLPNKLKFDHVYMIGGVTRRILPHLYGVVHFHVKRPWVRCRSYIRGEGIIGTCTIEPKPALVFGGFSQSQPQLIALFGEVKVDLKSVPKFTQQIRRCLSVDTLINTGNLEKELTAGRACRWGQPNTVDEFVNLNTRHSIIHAAGELSLSEKDLLPWPQLSQRTTL